MASIRPTPPFIKVEARPNRQLTSPEVLDLFSRLIDAFDARDFQAATRYRRELYRAGWSILPPKSPAWTGRRS